ncbi:hypothetical protein SteCoe_35116 [Stentor coeruleus]|uniref:Uncharacterized protein n=1 Tax=Stentor coeruleus TaxID=5963 RepID=A0A1R2AT13_9CILI|nr:hypothetical protein SteCoe_35116 [Stentor coeruleus]
MKKPEHIFTVPLAQPIPANSDLSWHLLTGGISGGISRTVTSPLERLKILRQCSSAEHIGLSFWQSMKKFYSLEGFHGFFKGNGSNVIRIVPFSALEFYVFEKAKHNLLPQDKPRHKGWLLICGSISGIIASFCTYPLDLVRTILSINVDRAGSGITKETLRIFRSEGFFGLYKGLNMTLFGIAPFIGIKMSTFDILKAHYLQDPKDKNLGKKTLILGGAAGAVATALTYPTDLLRRKMQLITYSKSTESPYQNIFQCIRWIYINEGIPGFYKGLVPCFAKVIPAMAVAFATNEELKKLLKVKSS